jgi:uncharacterized protein YgbK (DUF1537 family)
MPILTHARMLVLGDDLTGTAEAAAALLRPGRRIRIALDPLGDVGPGDLALDLDLRDRPEADIDAALAAVAPFVAEFAPDLLYLKIDSLLRGPVESLVGFALSISPDVLMAPALPHHGRTTENGRVFLDGVPAHRSALGQALGLRPVDTNLMDRLARFGPRRVLRAGRGALPGGLLIADAKDGDDLARLWERAAAGGGTRPRVMIGSAGLLTSGVDPAPMAPVRIAPPVLWVIGSRTPVARAQAGLLAAETSMFSGDRVITTQDASDGPDDPAASKVIAESAARIADGFACVFATGGATARAVAEALGLHQLTPAGEPQSGLIVLETGLKRPRHLMIRSGGFGDRKALLRLRRSFLGEQPDE